MRPLSIAFAFSSTVLCLSHGLMYQVSSPNLRETCTPRCSDTESKGRWRCDVSDDGAGICNTFELDGAVHGCHFHYYPPSEAVECLAEAGADILYVGDSYMSGMFASTFPWLDESTSGEEWLDVLKWLDEDFNGLNDYGEDQAGNSLFTQLMASQLNLDRTGITWKGGVTWLAQLSAPLSVYYNDLMDSAPEGDQYITYLHSKSIGGVHEGLDALKDAGRATRKAYMLLNVGAWYWYCAEYGGIYCSTLKEEGDAVIALESDSSAVLTLLQGKMVEVAERMKKDFPNYVLIFSDYGYNPANYKFVGKLSTMIKEVAAEYGHFLNLSDMQNVAANHPGSVSGHSIHMLNQVVLQRILSLVCQDTPMTIHEVECEEEVIMASSCQWRTGLDSLADAPGAQSGSSYYLQWYRPCYFTNYQSTATYSAAHSGFNYTTLSATDGVKEDGDDAASLLANLVVEAEKVDYYSTTATSDSTHRGSGGPLSPWDYKSWQLLLVLGSTVSVLAVYYRQQASKLTGVRRPAVVCANEATSSTLNSQSTAELEAESWGYLDAIEGARFLAAVHVVAYHYQDFRNPSYIESWYVIGWGFTWVPWFMMLSGFILTYSSLKRAALGKHVAPQTASQFMLARIMSVYPVYIVGLAADYVYALTTSHQWDKLTWVKSLAMLTLTQSWFPILTENVLQAQCWFISTIIPLWYFHQDLQKYMSSLTRRRLWVVMAVLAFMGWLPILIPYCLGVSPSWYTSHSWGATDDWTDILVTCLFFSPLSYVHLYAFGIGLAFLFREYRHSPPKVFKFGASIGYAGLTIVFCIPALEPPAHKLASYLGLLAPFQGLIVLGLSLGKSDPVSRLLGSQVMTWLGSYAYSIYVCQYAGFHLFMGWADLGMLTVLLMVSMVAVYISEKLFGMRGDVSKFMRGVKVVAGLYAVITAVVSVIPRQVLHDMKESSKREVETLGYVIYESGAYDVRLNVTNYPNRVHADPPVRDNEYDFINPSLLVVGGHMYLAARRHRLEFDTTPSLKVDGYKVITTQWYSDIYFGELDPNSLQMLAEFKKLHFYLAEDTVKYENDSFVGAEWTPCVEAPKFNAANGTYSQHVVTGPQDPRLFLQEDKLVMSFFSTTPQADGYCDESGTIGNMYVTDGDLRAGVAELGVHKIATPSDEQLFEKNWMAFPLDINESIGSAAQSRNNIGFIQHVSPFIAIKTDQYVITERYYAGRTHLDDARQDHKVDLHGGSNAVYVARMFEEPHMLACLHSLSSKGKYVNYLLKFSPEEPFIPLALSRPLPVVSRDDDLCPVFASGLTLSADGTRVLVGYGSCDEESRVLSLTWKDMDNLFTHPTQDDYSLGPEEYGIVGVGIDEAGSLTHQNPSSSASSKHGLSLFISVMLLTVSAYFIVFWYIRHTEHSSGNVTRPIALQHADNHDNDRVKASPLTSPSSCMSARSDRSLSPTGRSLLHGMDLSESSPSSPSKGWHDDEINTRKPCVALV